MVVKSVKKLADLVTPVEPETDEMEALLGVGYDGMTVEQAELILRERDQDPHLHPYEEFQKATAFLAAYHAKAEVVSTKAPWQRSRKS